MFGNYLKLTFRQLLKNKGFSVINISGLSIGMAAVILIWLWIRSEVSYDNFHVKRERIYELWNRGVYSGNLECWNTTPMVAAKFLEQDIPDIERVVRVEDWSADRLFTIGEKKLTLSGCIVDDDFLEVFTFPLIEGNIKTALNSSHSVLLTQTAATKLFGNGEAVGKTVNIDNKFDVIVSGIVADPPSNTRFKFEYLLGWKFLVMNAGHEDTRWGNNNIRNYVLLKENASLDAVNAKVKKIRQKYEEDPDALEMFLYPMERWHLHSNFVNGMEEGGKIEYVRLFGIISGFILLIACINFMNLSTARSEKRAREVGIRKTIGAQRHTLIGQFLGESVIVACIGFVLALALVYLSLPAFNELVVKQLVIDYGNVYFWLSALVFILFTGILAGSYPAFFLSAFQPVKVLKGSFKAAGALITPRKVLVVLQFTFAIILIICTVIVKQQINYVQQRQAGYNKDNLISVFFNDENKKNYAQIKRELLTGGIAVSMCKTSSPLTEGWSDSWGFEWSGKDPNDKTDFDRYSTDEGLVKTVGLDLLKGRDFNLTDFPSDSSAVILNESAVKAMGFKQPIGEIIKDNGLEWHVVGVIRDFILHSPYNATNPMVIEGAKKRWLNVINIKMSTIRPMSDNLKLTEAVFRKYSPAFPFKYSFVGQDYERKFDSEKRTGALATLFAGLTIFISCLGLFGLAAYMAENRVKEIGIRKVLGASVANITRLLSINFLKLVLISFLLAVPLAWWFMCHWLSDYPYHVSIKWWVFLWAGLISCLIAIITVSYQAIKAALASPVKSIRTE